MTRALILKYQIVTGMTIPPPEVLEHMRDSWSSEDRQEYRNRHRERQMQLEEALRSTGLWSSMSWSERAFVLAAPDRIDAQRIRDTAWSMESVECLLWALGVLETVPPYDTESDLEHLKRLPSEGIIELIRGASLRDPEAISKARDVAELWHWRSRTRELQDRQQDVLLPDGMSLVDVIRVAAETAAADGVCPAPIGGDFPLFGRAYAQLTAEEWSRATSIAMERHKALNWLCGYAPGNIWEKTPTHT